MSKPMTFCLSGISESRNFYKNPFRMNKLVLSGAILKRTALALILIITLLFSAMIEIQLINSVTDQTYSTIIIESDGNIEGTDKIRCRDNIYSFTGNVSGSILAKKATL